MIWTLSDIKRLPEFGSGMGWFYGLVRDDSGRVRLCEVIPGMGYGAIWKRDLIRPWTIVRDIFRYQPEKRA